MNPGSVPTDRIAPVLALAIRQRWPHGDGLSVLAEKADCDVSSIESVLLCEWPGIEFDLADRLLCAVGAQGTWWGELSDVYYGVEFRERCALPGCSKRFPERGSGSRIKRYCSEQCRHLDYEVRQGNASGMRNTRKGLCRKGLHKLTTDNILIRKGRTDRECRACARERHREYQREWKARQKVAA